ncbi:MAG: PD-(D/E)XK nuclease domain-containing protein, partial [Myxococcota bacterium]
SNLEVGLGRADLQLIPKKSGQAGVVMELKVVQKSQALLEGVVDALQQLEQKHYETLLESHQVSMMHRYGLAFNGKEVRVAELSQRSELEQALTHARAQALEQAREKAARRKRQNIPAAPKTSVLSLEERLELEERVLPALSSATLFDFWLGLGLSPAEFPAEGPVTQWRLLLMRTLELGQGAILGRLLMRQLPTLQDEPLVQKLRG